jgi:hypothetical protein
MAKGKNGSSSASKTKIKHSTAIVTDQSRTWQAILCWTAYSSVYFGQKQLHTSQLTEHCFSAYQSEVDNFINRRGLWSDVEESTDLATKEVIEKNKAGVIVATYKPLLIIKSKKKIDGTSILRKAKDVKTLLTKFISFLNDQASKESQDINGPFCFSLKQAVQVEGVECAKLLDIVIDSGKNEESMWLHLLFLYQSCGGFELVTKKDKKGKVYDENGKEIVKWHFSISLIAETPA